MYFSGNGEDVIKTITLSNSGNVTLKALDWTDELPTENGWYWVKRNRWKQPFVYWYEVDNEYVGYVGSDIHIREVELWLGPIPEPEMPKG